MTDASTPSRTARILSAGGALLATTAFYTLLVAWLTWPRARVMTTQIPTSFAVVDTLLVGWMQAFLAHAFLEAPGSLLGGNIYHPAPHALFYGPTHFGALPVLAPLYAISSNPTWLLNALGTVALTASAVSIHLVVRRWSESHVAGIVAGVCFLLNASILRYGMLLPGYILLAYLPWILLLVAEPPKTTLGVVGLGALIALQCLIGPLYLAPGIGLPLGLIILWRLARPDRRPDGLRLLAACLVALVLASPVYASYLSVFSSQDLSTNSIWAGGDAFVEPDPGPWSLARRLGMLLNAPAWLAVIAGSLVVLRRPQTTSPELTRGLALSAFWAAACLPILIGVRGTLAGIEFRLPLGLLAEVLPPLGNLRNVARLAILMHVPLSMATGLGFAAVLRWGTSRGDVTRSNSIWAATAVGLVAVLAATNPLAVTKHWQFLRPTRSAPEIVSALRAETGPLLVLPASDIVRRTPVGGLRNARIEFESAAHWKPLLNGYAGYYPEGFRERMELASQLPDPTALRQLVKETGVELILVRWISFPKETRNRWRKIAAGRRPQDGLLLLTQTPKEMLFRVALNQAAAGSTAPRRRQIRIRPPGPQ